MARKSGAAGAVAGAAGEPGPEPAGGPGSKATQFGPGNNANPNGRKGRQPEPSEVPADPLAGRVLCDLWHVYHRPKAEDRTQGQFLFRKLLERAPERFLQRLAKEEADLRAAKQVAAERERAADLDPGAAAADGLIDRLLAERPWEESGDAEPG